MKLYEFLEEIEYPMRYHLKWVEDKDQTPQAPNTPGLINLSSPSIRMHQEDNLSKRWFSGRYGDDSMLNNNMDKDILYAQIRNGEGVFALRLHGSIGFYMVSVEVHTKWDDRGSSGKQCILKGVVTRTISRIKEPAFDAAIYQLQNPMTYHVQEEHPDFAGLQLVRALKQKR